MFLNQYNVTSCCTYICLYSFVVYCESWCIPGKINKWVIALYIVGLKFDIKSGQFVLMNYIYDD